MKKLTTLLSLFISVNAFSIEGVHLDLKPSFGIGTDSSKMYAIARVSAFRISEPNDKISAKVLSLGYVVGAFNGLTLTPVIIQYNKIGVGLDFSIKKRSNAAGLSLSYCF